MTELKRVSFEVAKAIKEAGFNKICEYGYCVTDGIPNLVKTEDEWERCLINNSDMHDYLVCTCQETDGKDDCIAPTYMEVWLWLWREKGIKIDTTARFDSIKGWLVIALITNGCWTYHVECSDPEEAIIAAIEYLVKNNLIK